MHEVVQPALTPLCSRCTGNFYGTQCEVDGEVLGVAVGASVAAVVIIVLTLVCLCMWSRRWSREQKSASGLGYGSPVFGYLGGGGAVKTPAVGTPPYQVTLEERLRWAQIADAMAQVQASNHYAVSRGTVAVKWKKGISPNGATMPLTCW